MKSIPLNDNSNNKLLNILEIYTNKEMEKEIDTIIEASKQEPNAPNLIRNGFVYKKVKTLYGVMKLKIARLLGSGINIELADSNTYKSSINKLACLLYGQGLSTRRISETLQEAFGISICSSTVSNICKELNSSVNSYLNSPIDSKIIAVYLDCKYFSVTSIATDEVEYKRKTPLANAIGLCSDGTLIHLHMKHIKRESQSEMTLFLNELQGKINGDVDVFIVDGADAVANAIGATFPNSRIQRCLFHVVQNIKKNLSKITTPKMKLEIESDFKHLFFEISSTETASTLATILNKYPQYKNVIKNSISDPNIWTYTCYTHSIGTLIKTNNVIERFHSSLEAVTHQHKLYKGDKSLYRALIQEIIRFNEAKHFLEYSDTIVFKTTKDKLDIQKELRKHDIIATNTYEVILTTNGRITHSENITQKQNKEVKELLKE